MTRFFLIFFLLSSPCFGQAWSGIISSSRAINWGNAGLPAALPDGETTPNPWTPPNRTQCGSTISAGASAATINAALAACPTGTYVLLGAGAFTLNNAVISMYAQNGVTLRGSGAQSTIFKLTGNSHFDFSYADYGSGSCSWSAGYSAGTTSISLTGCSGPTLKVGEILTLQQCDTGYSGSGCTTGAAADNGWLYICGFNTACQRGGEGTGNLPEQTQIVYVTAVSGTGPYTVTISPGLYMPNWSSGNSPIASWTQGAHTVTPYGNGLEDMTIASSSATGNELVYLDGAYASWVKGVRFIGSGAITPLFFQGCKNSLVLNNYTFSDPAIDSIYPPAMQEGADSDNLVINNIGTSGEPWEGTGEMEGDVFAYNYSRDSFTAYVIDTFEHNAGNALNLYEGNLTPSIQEDDTHGTHDLSTLFRNGVLGWEAPYTTENLAGITLDSYNRFSNIIGNAIGDSGKLTCYTSSMGVPLLFVRLLSRLNLLRS